MRHKKNFNHLSRTKAHRKAMLSNMAASLILHKRINTTLAKAKALRSFIEPLITKAKKGSDEAHRLVFKVLQSKKATKELFSVVREKVGDRPGGYTRILKTGFRLGDNAKMCIIELVDFNEAWLEGKDSKEAKATKKTRRTRRGRGTKKNTSAETEEIKQQENAQAEEASNENISNRKDEGNA